MQATDDALNDSKAGLLQHVLDIHRITRTTTESLEADAEWLAETCRMPLHLISRADALAAQATFSTNARADALTTAQLQDDAHTFMSHVAGPQHLSRMQSPRLGAWLMTCPTLQNQDALAIKVSQDSVAYGTGSSSECVLHLLAVCRHFWTCKSELRQGQKLFKMSLCITVMNVRLHTQCSCMLARA